MKVSCEDVHGLEFFQADFCKTFDFKIKHTIGDAFRNSRVKCGSGEKLILIVLTCHVLQTGTQERCVQL